MSDLDAVLSRARFLREVEAAYDGWLGVERQVIGTGNSRGPVRGSSPVVGSPRPGVPLVDWWCLSHDEWADDDHERRIRAFGAGERCVLTVRKVDQ